MGNLDIMVLAEPVRSANLRRGVGFNEAYKSILNNSYINNVVLDLVGFNNFKVRTEESIGVKQLEPYVPQAIIVPLRPREHKVIPDLLRKYENPSTRNYTYGVYLRQPEVDLLELRYKGTPKRPRKIHLFEAFRHLEDFELDDTTSKVIYKPTGEKVSRNFVANHIEGTFESWFKDHFKKYLLK